MRNKKSGEVIDELNKNHDALMGSIFESFRGRRRGFLGMLGATSLGAMLAKKADAAIVQPLGPVPRRDQAYLRRINQAHANLNAALLTGQVTNGDEEAFSNKIGSYTKGLPHSSSNGTVSLSAYNTLINALASGTPASFEQITLGGTRKQVNPQGGWAFEMEGGDGPNFRIQVPPRFSSREEAAEIAENYWMALLRDVPFRSYSGNAIAQAAAADLTRYGSDAKVPKNSSGQVTPDLLFRGNTPGDRVGPFLSQFFALPCPFGLNAIEQRVLHPVANVNFMTTWNSWLAVQNGSEPGGLSFENTLRYMRSGRGIGEWVHVDVLFQGYFMAFLILSALGAQLDAGNPYNNTQKQIGFATFGGPHIATLLCEVSTRALHAAWYQKWFAHRRLRPEAFAGAIHARLFRGANFPIHQEILNDLNTSHRLGGFVNTQALLPMAFPEGSPTHPAYPAGHATVAGACTTILKAWFNESWVIPSSVTRQARADGLSLEPFKSASLTVGGELNKIASNIANGRNIAGVHWRSDTAGSLALGEAVAIQLMKEHNVTFNENFSGFKLTKFDGSTITV